MSALSIPTKTSLSNFERLPPEIRNMVYALCIVTSTVIIRSPLTKYHRKDRPRSTFWHLLLTNKNIRDEASAWFYRSTCFVFGNGNWGSTAHPNEQAMRAFISRVPKTRLSFISKIEIAIHTRSYWREGKRILGNSEDVKDLLAIASSIVKHLKTLESVKISCFKDKSSFYTTMYVGKRLVGEEVNQSLKRFIEKLLTCKCLKSLEVFRDNKIPLHEVAEWIIKERPDTASIFKIPEKSVMEQV